MQNGSFGIVTIIHWNVYKDKQFSLKIYTRRILFQVFLVVCKKLVKVIERERRGIMNMMPCLMQIRIDELKKKRKKKFS